jgi:threonyl-tRNA synthetase
MVLRLILWPLTLLGREWQLATEQLDLIMPKRFGLTYTNTHGEEQQPVMIHKALLGSFERFLSVYLRAYQMVNFRCGWHQNSLRVTTLNDEKKSCKQQEI